MTSPVDFGSRTWRSRFEARMLDRLTPIINEAIGAEKSAAIGGMGGTIVEIGAGTGANMGFYPPGVDLIAVEPNPHMHPRLRAAAERHDVSLEIREIVGEQIDLADGSADAVVGTLVLCGVADVEAVLGEVHRILKPGGTYFFVEHVVAPDRGIVRTAQRMVKRPHRWLFNGCEVDRDTATAIEGAGFGRVEWSRRDAGVLAGWTRHQIIGTATR